MRTTYSALLNNVKNIALAAEFGFGAFTMPGYDYLPACEGTKEHKDNSRFSGIGGRFRI